MARRRRIMGYTAAGPLFSLGQSKPKGANISRKRRHVLGAPRFPGWIMGGTRRRRRKGRR